MALLSPAVSSPSTPYKLRTRMDNEEGIALIRSFQWAVDVECLVDGELFPSTDVMNVEVKAREGDPAPCLVVTIGCHPTAGTTCCAEGFSQRSPPATMVQSTE